jgi:YbbR domain-containing protein
MKRTWQKLVSYVSGDLALKLFSLFFAAGLWFFVNAGQKAAERAMEVPVEIRNVASELMVVNPGISAVEVRLMGPPALLSTLDPDDLKVSLDLDGARPGTSTFRVSADSFNPPPRGVRVTRISPSVVNVKLETVAARSLPVTVRLGGKLPVGYKIARLESTPEAVKVRGPASEVNNMTAVETVPLELDGVKGQTTREVRLSSAGGTLSFSPDRVTVSLALEEEMITREFGRVEVKVKDFSGRYTVTPRQVSIKLFGPKRVLESLQLGPDRVYLNLKGLSPGNHNLPLSMNLPREVKVLEQKPDRFRVVIGGSEG